MRKRTIQAMRICAVVALAIMGGAAWAQTVPEMINYQGRLLDANGAALAGDRDLRFTIYDAAEAGAALWGPQTITGVSLFGGNFNVVLGPTDDGAASIMDAFAGSTAFLGISVADPGGAFGPEISPRQQILSVPYAIKAKESESTNIGDQLADLIARIEVLEGSQFPPGSHVWSFKLEGTAFSVEGNAIAVDGNRDVIVVGDFETAVDFGDGAPLTTAGLRDIFVVKYSGANGSIIWAKRFGGALNDNGDGVAVDAAGDVYIVGGFGSSTINFGGEDLPLIMDQFNSPDIFVAKLLGSDGSHVWSNNYGTTNTDFALAVAIDGEGAVGVTGVINGSVDGTLGGPLNIGLPGRAEDIFVAKYQGSDGGHLWSRVFSSILGQSSFDDVGRAIAFAPNGDVVLAGSHQGNIRFGALDTLNHKGIADPGGPHDQILIAKLSGTDGAPIWSKSFGNQENALERDEQGLGVVVDSGGNIFMTGIFYESGNFGGQLLSASFFDNIFLVKFAGDGQGSHVWSVAFGMKTPIQGNGTGNAIALDSAENPIITGPMSGTINFGGAPIEEVGIGEDVYIAKFSKEDASHIWSKGYDPDGLGTSIGNAVAAGGGRLFTTGWFTGSIDFGGGAFSVANRSAYVVRLFE